MRVLITGVCGFAGSHLAKSLVAAGVELHGTVRPGDKAVPGWIKKDVELHSCDLSEKRSVTRVVQRVKPDRVYHLAARTSVPESWDDADSYYRTNFLGTVYLLEAARLLARPVRIHVACSSSEYGNASGRGGGICEEAQLNPVNPYAVSKTCQDMACVQYCLKYGLHVVRTRAFNHTGPGQGSSFVCSAFARQIAEIEACRRKPVLMAGNLDSKRDFLDVRDVVRAYRMVMEKAGPGTVYNVCSGNAVSVRKIIGILGKKAKVKFEIRQDTSRLRKFDVPVQKGSCAKIARDIGWKPEIEFDRTLSDLLEYWREELRIKGV